MKLLAKVFSVAVMVSVVAGCASSSDVYVPKVPPGAQAMLLDYYQQPDNKVFVLAVDPSGEFAAGYEYGKSTTKEAAKIAYESCAAGCKSGGVLAKPYIYAINDKVVYKETITSEQKK